MLARLEAGEADAILTYHLTRLARNSYDGGRLIYMMDEPAAGPGLFPQYMVSKLARAHVKVVLGGQGGDELFGGYARYLVAYLEQAMKGAIYDKGNDPRYVV